MVQESTSPSSTPRSVVILGGGLAGMAAACHLLDAGCQVTLVEKRPYLGGRAFSFTDRETGQEVDNGQHVFLGCCDYYIDFLKKLGTFRRAHLQPETNVEVMSPQTGVSRIYASGWPRPLHLLPAFLSYKHLGLRDKLMAVFGLLRISVADRHKPSLQNRTFGHWLRRNGQTRRAIDNFWGLIVKPCVNDEVEDVSAAMGLMIFQEGLLKTRGGSRIGFAREGLSSLMGEAAKEYIESRGGRIISGSAAAALQVENGAVSRVQLAGGGTVRGDAYVSALGFGQLAPLLPEDMIKAPYFAALRELETAPIVNVHLWYDRPVMSQDFVAFVDSPLQWVFNKSSIMEQGEAGGEQYITISLSGAFDYIDQSKRALEQTFIDAMGDSFPRAKVARVKRVIIVKQREATFRCLPGSEAHRPGARTPMPNLYLAGDWTNTGWPSTMEGAVRSGVTAAEAALDGNRP